MHVRNLILTLAVCALVAACGSDSRLPTAPAGPPAAPATPPAPPPTSQQWSGTFESSNWSFSPFPITVLLERSGNTITGSWFEMVWMDLGGKIEGTVDDTSFTGTVTINQCAAVFHGTLTEKTLSWSSPGVTDGCGPIFSSTGNPVDIKLVSSR